MEHTRVVIIYIGVHDLERCADKGDFLRWEIDLARELETKNKVKIAIVIHGVQDWRDLFSHDLKRTGWGKGLMSYFESHFITFFYVDRIQDTINKLRSISDARRKGAQRKEVTESQFPN